MIRKYYISKIRIEDVLAQSDYYVQSVNKAFHAFLETKIFNAQITKDDLFKISVAKICIKYSVSEEYFRNIFSGFYEAFLSKVLLPDCLTVFPHSSFLTLSSM